MPAFRETPARMRWYDAVQKEHVYTGSGSKIELHRRLLSNRFLFDPPFDRLDAEGAYRRDGWAGRFRTLGDADQLLYLACHGIGALLAAPQVAVRRRRISPHDGRRRRSRRRSLVVDKGQLEKHPRIATLRLCREDLHIEADGIGGGGAARSTGARVRFAAGRVAALVDAARRAVRHVDAGRWQCGPRKGVPPHRLSGTAWTRRAAC